MNIPFKPGLVIPMDPGEVLDYTLDCTKWLAGGMLDSALVEYEGCIVQPPTVIGPRVTFRVSNVFAKPAVVTLTVIAADGQREVVVFRFTNQKG